MSLSFGKIFRNRIIIVSIILLISGSIQILWITDPPGSHPASGSVPGSSSFPFCKKIGAFPAYPESSCQLVPYSIVVPVPALPEMRGTAYRLCVFHPAIHLLIHLVLMRPAGQQSRRPSDQCSQILRYVPSSTRGAGSSPHQKHWHCCNRRVPCSVCAL